MTCLNIETSTQWRRRRRRWPAAAFVPTVTWWWHSTSQESTPSLVFPRKQNTFACESSFKLECLMQCIANHNWHTGEKNSSKQFDVDIAEREHCCFRGWFLTAHQNGLNSPFSIHFKYLTEKINSPSTAATATTSITIDRIHARCVPIEKCIFEIHSRCI